MTKLTRWILGVATAGIAAFTMNTHAQEACALSISSDGSFRRSVESFVQKHESLSMGFEEDGCARVGQAIDILNRTLKGDFFKAARQFDFFMLTDEDEEFNTFMIVRLIFEGEEELARLESLFREKKPRAAKSEAPLSLEAVFKGKEFIVLFSPTSFFDKNRETFGALHGVSAP